MGNKPTQPKTPIVENRFVVLERDSLEESLHELAVDLNRFVLGRHGYRNGDKLHVTLVIRVDETPPEIASDPKIG